MVASVSLTLVCQILPGHNTNDVFLRSAQSLPCTWRSASYQLQCEYRLIHIPQAYTHYSFFEWSLIILDILYDAIARYDFEAANLQVRGLLTEVNMKLTCHAFADQNQLAR